MSNQLKFDNLIIDGIFYQSLPQQFVPDYSDYGVSATNDSLLDGKNILVVASQPTDDADPQISRRKLKLQGWKMSFGGSSPAFLQLRDHLSNLNTLQKPFWIQYDDEMSRGFANLQTVGPEYHAYYTPTFPIFPYGHEPGDPINFSDSVYINGELFTGGTIVYPELGVVKFPETYVETMGVKTPRPIPGEHAAVQMKYTWRAYVRIAALDIVQHDEIAAERYQIEVTLEQLPFPYNYEQTITWNSDPYNTCPVDDHKRRIKADVAVTAFVKAHAMDTVVHRSVLATIITEQGTVDIIKATIGGKYKVVHGSVFGDISVQNVANPTVIPTITDKTRSVLGDITFTNNVIGYAPAGLVVKTRSILGTIIWDTEVIPSLYTGPVFKVRTVNGDLTFGAYANATVVGTAGTATYYVLSRTTYGYRPLDLATITTKMNDGSVNDTTTHEDTTGSGELGLTILYDSVIGGHDNCDGGL